MSSTEGSGSGFREYSSGDKQNNLIGTDLTLHFQSSANFCKFVVDRETLPGNIEASGDPKPSRKPGEKPSKKPPKNDIFSGDLESSGEFEASGLEIEESSGSEFSNTTMKLVATEKTVSETSSKSDSGQSGSVVQSPAAAPGPSTGVTLSPYPVEKPSTPETKQSASSLVAKLAILYNIIQCV